MKRLVLVAVLLASSVFAQAPVPAGLLPELAVPGAEARTVALGGSSSVVARGDRFTIVTTYEGASVTHHGLMEVDAQGSPMRPLTGIIGNCGTKAESASDGDGVLTVWGCLGGTAGWLSAADGTGGAIAIHDQTRNAFSRRDFSGVRGVAWDGGQYVVLSTLETLNPSSGAIAYRAIATRIGPDGSILQNDIELGSTYGYAIAARSGVSVMLLVSDGLVVRAMNAAGVLSPPQQVASGSSFGIPAIAAGPEGFLVVWGDANGVRIQHLRADGTVEGSPMLLDSAAAQSVAVTAEGTGYRVAWSAAQEIRAARIGAGMPGPSATVAAGWAPALASNGTTTMLVWSAPDGTRARPIDDAGSGELVHALADLQSLVSVAMTPAGVALAWNERSSVSPLVESSHLLDRSRHLVRDAGTITHLRGFDRALILEGSYPRFTVRYADAPEVSFEVPSRRLFWTGDGFLAVWTGEGANADPFTGVPLLVQRFDAGGHPLDAVPRMVGVSYPLDAAYTGAAAAYNGVAVGASNDEILLTYVDPWASVQGVILRGDETIPIGTVATPYALARPIEITSDGSDFLVTWISNADTIHSYVGSRRVLAGGAMPEEMRVQTTAGTRKERMATFWTGEHYLVVWSSVDDFGLSRTIAAIRIARDGTLMDYPERVIGTIEGYVPQFAYRDGLLAVAYERDGRVWWRYAGTPRRRAIGR